ncbi:MAG: glucuronyl esterase domain-containing protein [Alphaproteobacteria bacterium]
MAAQKKPRRMWRKKRVWAFVAALLFLLLITSCSSTRMLMKTASNKPIGADARPSIDAASLAQWETERPKILNDFANTVYGGLDAGLSLDLQNVTKLEGVHFDGSAKLEFHQFKTLKDGIDTHRDFGMVLVRPVQVDGPAPIIMMQNFCPNHDVIPHPAVPRPETLTFSCSGDSFLSGIFTYFFGRYITTPPIAGIMAHGYALAVVYPSKFVPDSRADGQIVLDTAFADQPENTRSGAIAAWAMQFSLLTSYLDKDEAVSEKIAYGHSRFGKSALLAAAINPNIDGVIAHQSGTGGASLTRGKPGETLTDITQSYPFWFSRAFAGYSGHESGLPVDQHQLLALIAPRPILLGNAKRDVWSDPNGAFKAAEGASPVYELFGRKGLSQATLTDYQPAADIAFWMRPGTHGVTQEDWPAFLAFLDAHFK